MALLLLLGSGCTSLREIPRSEYAAQPERKDVRVETRDSLVYELDYVRVQSDTLIGFRRRDTEGPFDDFATLRIPMDDINHLLARSVDWYRTSVVGLGALGVVVVAGLTAAGRNEKSDNSSGNGKPPIP